jgi:hypothetical protein
MGVKNLIIYDGRPPSMMDAVLPAIFDGGRVIHHHQKHELL